MKMKLIVLLHQHQPDLIMHLAAESHVDRSIDGPSEFIQTNIVGTYISFGTSKTLLVKTKEVGKKINFDFIMYQLMRFMVIFK